MAHGNRADARIPVTKETRNLLRERKDDKESYDKYLRELMGVE